MQQQSCTETSIKAKAEKNLHCYLIVVLLVHLLHLNDGIKLFYVTGFMIILGLFKDC